MAINTDVYMIGEASPSYVPWGKDQKYAPVKIAGEVFVLHRDGIGFEFHGTQGGSSREASGMGCIHLTSHRIVFIKNGNVEDHSSFTCFEIPLAYFSSVSSIHGLPEFNQPIFGTNYLEGKVLRLVGAKQPVEGVVKIKFKKGGADKFLKMFIELWRQTKINERNNQAKQPRGDGWSINNFMAGEVGIVGNDISVVYTKQPENPNNTPDREGYGDLGIPSTMDDMYYKPH